MTTVCEVCGGKIIRQCKCKESAHQYDNDDQLRESILNGHGVSCCNGHNYSPGRPEVCVPFGELVLHIAKVRSTEVPTIPSTDLSEENLNVTPTRRGQLFVAAK